MVGEGWPVEACHSWKLFRGTVILVTGFLDTNRNTLIVPSAYIKIFLSASVSSGSVTINDDSSVQVLAEEAHPVDRFDPAVS